MDVLHRIIEFQDLFFRFRNKIRRLVLKKNEFSSSATSSDSQESFYVDQIISLFGNKTALMNFRRNYDYREILEHVDYELGKKYLDLIKRENNVDWREILKLAIRNDSYGNPYTYRYEKELRISPTTLRYVQTALDIKETIGLNSGDRVAEIGVGYGGQASILESIFNVRNYHAFDLPEVIDLSNEFLRGIGSRIKFDKVLNTESKVRAFDVVISNYAFSELNRELQIEYLDNLITRIPRGYMIMNSGRSNLTGRSNGKLTLKEILMHLPNAKVKEEVPISGPDNYVLYWRN